ncbi:MAG TPA: hemin uptake protein HemP [Rhodocyclaceae bacterium]|nr:hemin uptake protein HemP [Rhodocyclaceae bacterium]
MNMAQHQKSQPTSPAAALPPAGQLLQVKSSDLLRGQTMVEIEHGGQRYTLRVTRQDKLILTK